jgi:hypothetical protein
MGPLTYDPPTEAKQRFVRALAKYLASDLARKSHELELGKPAAIDWATLREAVPLALDYQSIDETERLLGRWLGVPTPERG